ncbi:MAG: hypothetical protein CL624_11600 [Arcobacter sp.]|nr:hypothetical protein [Arcobacter sp.]|tara:strand:- start:7491 stop:7790 length:300 start_codon:yes stop_codon:yes gene_type:complete
MQTIIFLLLTFLIVIFSVLQYFKSKKTREAKLNSGECPSCGEKAKTFFDEATQTKFKQEVIKAKVLKNHGCSGVNEIEFRCSACGLKEVHQMSSAGCNL